MNPATGSSRGRARGCGAFCDRHRVVQRLAHQPPVHAELARHPLDRPDPELILPSDLLEQLHRGLPPTHPDRPHLLTSCRVGTSLTRSQVGHSRASKWARPEYRKQLADGGAEEAQFASSSSDSSDDYLHGLLPDSTGPQAARQSSVKTGNPRPFS